MGWGAAMQYADDTGMEPDEAYDVLYGSRSEGKPLRCPICNKKKVTIKAVLQHAEAAHRKPQHIERVAAWWVAQAKEKAQREPGQSQQGTGKVGCAGRD